MGQQASFSNVEPEEVIQNTRTISKEDLKSELKMKRLLRLPVKSLREIFGYNAVLDSGATSSFIKPEDGAIPTGEKSNKKVNMPNGNSLKTSHKALLPNKSLNAKARECDILPGLQHSSLVSVGKLADAGYCTIFMPGNQCVYVMDGNQVKVHVSGEAVLRGWRDHQGLWRVPLEDGESVALTQEELDESINNVFDLPSTEQKSDTCMRVLASPPR